jgi:hypothetical protein
VSAAWTLRVDDPRRFLESPEYRFPMMPGDTSVNCRALDVPVTQMILDEGHGEAGVKEMGGYRVTKAMGRVPPVQAGAVAVPGEKGLDLPFLQRPPPAREQGIRPLANCLKVLAKEPPRALEERAFSPHTPLYTLHNKPRIRIVFCSTALRGLWLECKEESLSSYPASASFR